MLTKEIQSLTADQCHRPIYKQDPVRLDAGTALQPESSKSEDEAGPAILIPSHALLGTIIPSTASPQVFLNDFVVSIPANRSIASRCCCLPHAVPARVWPAHEMWQTSRHHLLAHAGLPVRLSM